MVGSSPTDLKKPESVERYIQQYIADHARMVLITDTIPAKEGRPATTEIVSQLDYRDGVRVRYARRDKLLRFSKGHFRNWLKNGPFKVGPSEIVQAIMVTQPAARTLRVSLAAGTNLTNVGREEVLEVSNWKHFNMEEAS